MKFEVAIDRDAGLTAVEAGPNPYDGCPAAGRVIFGHAPQSLDPELEALLCTLVFFEFISD